MTTPRTELDTRFSDPAALHRGSGSAWAVAGGLREDDCRVAIKRRGVAGSPSGSVVRVHGDGDLCERFLSDAASRGAPVAQDRPEIVTATHELRPAVTHWS
jgi:hypothetical protein